MDFSALTKKSSDSFNQQRNILKQLAKGKTIKCPDCQQPLKLDLNTAQPGQGVAKCIKGCTEIQLDLA